MRLYHAVYYSNCNAKTREQMSDILAQSRVNNIAAGITGALVVSDLHCLQVIEGPRSALTHLLSRILRDDRHDGCVLALLEDLDERCFPDWSMGVANLTPEVCTRLNDYGLSHANDPSQMSGRMIWELVHLVAGPEGRENGFLSIG